MNVKHIIKTLTFATFQQPDTVISNTIHFTCTKNIGNRVKQCKNLKKIFKGVNACCFSTIPVKTCAK